MEKIPQEVIAPDEPDAMPEEPDLEEAEAEEVDEAEELKASSEEDSEPEAQEPTVEDSDPDEGFGDTPGVDSPSCANCQEHKEIVCSGCWRSKYPLADIRMGNGLFQKIDGETVLVADFVD